MHSKITSPTLVLNKDICIRNIQQMSDKAAKDNLKFRPHFKTHQSLEIGRWFKEFRIDGITVSSLKMAEYFADYGWDSITIALPVNILEHERINELALRVELRILLVDEGVVKALDELLSSNLKAYIEIDPDYGRSGIHYSDNEKLNKLIDSIHESKHLTLHGFYSHAGHSYKSRSKEEILKCSVPIVKELSSLKEKYKLPICFGDTPSCSTLEDFGDIDEISPGNFVFYDWIQTTIGSCSEEQIAVAMLCPVVAKYESRNQLLIHGGAVHFSKDFDTKNGVPYFGQITTINETGWGNSLIDCHLSSISQEHGIVTCTNEFFDETSIGDLVCIYPIHSCLNANLMGSYLTTEGENISHLSEKKK